MANRWTSPHARSRRLLGELAAAGAILVFVSAVWMETSAYRYMALALLVPATIHYLRDEGPPFYPMAILCIGWAIYVALRFGYVLFFHPELGMGTSEGIYLFPLFYPLFGYALLIYAPRPFAIVVGFMIISCAAVVLSTDYGALLEGERAWESFHKNPIHASVANGIVVLCTLPFISYVLRREGLSFRTRAGLAGFAGITFVIGLAGIYALQSKGVWLALSVSLPVLCLLMVTAHDRPVLRLVIAIAGLGVALAVWLRFDDVWAVIGDTYEAASTMAGRMLVNGDLLGEVERGLIEGELPNSFLERAELWANAILLWAEAPLFGKGVAWLYYWQFRPLDYANYSLIHNGYLEIAVRYGIVGLVFYVSLFVWATMIIYRAVKKGIFDISVFNCHLAVMIFFAVTLLTNSNNRLTIGETYMWFTIGFAFYSLFVLQHGWRISYPYGDQDSLQACGNEHRSRSGQVSP